MFHVYNDMRSTRGNNFVGGLSNTRLENNCHMRITVTPTQVKMHFSLVYIIWTKTYYSSEIIEWNIIRNIESFTMKII